MINLKLIFAILLTFALFLTEKAAAQSYANWYKNAQQRIDTLRKGDFGIRIVDEQGNSYTGSVSVRMQKHEFPFGAAFDFNQGEGSMGNIYSTSDKVQAKADAEIYQTERWDKYLAYALPVEIGKQYTLTLKFAEIYHGANNARIFDVMVEGNLLLDDFDTHALAGGKNIAIDTTIQVVASNERLNVEFRASVDNVALKGIILEGSDGTIVRINCGGPAMTTASGNKYVSEDGFFDPDVNTIASQEQWMKAAMYKYFNAGVSGNSFKWSGIQNRQNELTYNNFDNAVKWTQKVGWDLRAHTLLWGGNDNHSLPDWVRALPTPQAITDTCKMRVIREVTRYRGIIKEYDVVNEPLSGHADWLRKTVGDSIIWNAFKWARSADPDAELYVNDYNVEYNWGQAVEYRDLILKMLENGAPVTGVGIQAHFWNCCRPNVDELVKNINIIAEAGLPIKLTEFDYSEELDQKDQTADYIKVLTIAFSHPSIVGLMHWAVSDQGAWRPNTGLFDANFKPKLAADTLLYYTKVKWATNFDSVMTAVDPLVFNAYYGHYEIEVEKDGKTMVFKAPLIKANKDSILTLNMADAMLKGPQLLKAEMKDDMTILLTFDKALNGEKLRRSDFKVFSAASISLEAVQVDQSESNTILLSLGKAPVKGSYLAVSYFPGKLFATDGSMAKAFGPEAVSFPEEGNSVFTINNDFVRIFPNPATTQLQINSASAPYTLELFNSMGQKVLEQRIVNENHTLNIGEYRKGMYLLKLSGNDEQTKVMKVLFN